MFTTHLEIEWLLCGCACWDVDHSAAAGGELAPSRGLDEALSGFSTSAAPHVITVQDHYPKWMPNLTQLYGSSYFDFLYLKNTQFDDFMAYNG